MTQPLRAHYALGRADLDGPPGGFVLRKIVRQSRHLGRTGTPPWVLLPASALCFRNRQRAVPATGAPAFVDLAPQEKAALRMMETLIESQRQADTLFLAYDEAQWRQTGATGDFTELPAFEMAITFVDAVQATALYRGLDQQPVAVNLTKRRVQSPILLGADMIAFHHEVWPHVPMPD